MNNTNNYENNLTGYPSIDKPWLKHYSEETLNIPQQECTLYENIYKNNRSYPNDIALEYFGNRITYKLLFKNVDVVKMALIKLGIKKDDKVIMFTSSNPETVYVILALCRIGAVANMINPLFSNEQIINRINETDATVLIALDQLYAKISGAIKNTCIKTTVIIPIWNSMPAVMKKIASIKIKKKISYNSNVLKWNSLISLGTDNITNDDEAYERDRPLIMVYSSGTTGASKGIVLTNDGINATISHYFNADFSYERGNTFLQIIPIWFSTGAVFSILMPLCLGITVILEPVFSKETFAKNIKKYKPNMTLGATSLWIYATACKELKNTNMSFMNYPITGGEQVISRVELSINSFLKSHKCEAVLLKGYGMCELGSTVSSDSLSLKKNGSTGFPILNVTVAAFDTETNKEKKYNERGEIRVLSPARMKEYFKKPEDTKNFFYKDKSGNLWGRTGDIGYVDEDGFVFILGRASDFFISPDGERHYLFDAENVILENESVDLCEVLTVKSEKYNREIPVAHIVLKQDFSGSSEEFIRSIDKSCKEKLTEYAVPMGYKIREGFAIKPNGKRDTLSLKDEREGFIGINDGTVQRFNIE